MKTLLITAIIIANSILAMAQVTLDKSYAYSTSNCEINGTDYYFLMDVPSAQCRIYSNDHSLYKTINLTIPSGYYLSNVQFISTHLFNTDDLIELVYTYEKYVSTESSYYMIYGMAVTNENGNQLLLLSNGGFAEIKNIESQNKLLAYTYIYNTLGYYDVVTNIYSLGGTATISAKSTIKSNWIFPNPASNVVTINTEGYPEALGAEFSLYSVNGQKVMSTTINNKELVLPVNHLHPGQYTYSIKNKNILIHSNNIIIQ